MSELVDWLRAQLDEDERSIRTWGSACVHIEACFETGDFTDRFGEDRLLAEVDAKRRILDRSALYARDLVKLLALPYADRDGYREEWRP